MAKFSASEGGLHWSTVIDLPNADHHDGSDLDVAVGKIAVDPDDTKICVLLNRKIAADQDLEQFIGILSTEDGALLRNYESVGSVARLNKPEVTSLMLNRNGIVIMSFSEKSCLSQRSETGCPPSIKIGKFDPVGLEPFQMLEAHGLIGSLSTSLHVDSPQGQFSTLFGGSTK